MPTNIPCPNIILITGNMASGKSSVAQALAERLPKSVHLRGDLFRRMIINGRTEMTFNLSAEAHQQLLLRYDLAVTTAKRYVQAGFTVIYQDVIIGVALRDVLASFYPYQPGVVVLCPRPDVVEMRDQARQKTGYPDRASVETFDHILRSETPHIGYWLDNSDLSVIKTVEAILHHFAEAAISQSYAK
ncbi:MAG: AAA family ATPase [Anaerolineae bacterium]|nr:AAA family ATPase [Anaerolineae bacterium]